MVDLLNNYSISEILIFLVVFAIALKSVITFWDWGVDRLRKFFHKEHAAQGEKELIEERLNEGNSKFAVLFDNQQKQSEQINEIIEKINLLIASDKDDIKSFITREHHYFCYQKHWIDDYSLDCVERRYNHYNDEGGNSFVLNLMNQIRALPNHPPKEEENK